MAIVKFTITVTGHDTVNDGLYNTATEYGD